MLLEPLTPQHTLLKLPLLFMLLSSTMRNGCMMER
jgi:hypothetical protein